jgi:hypothetical protein
MCISSRRPLSFRPTQTPRDGSSGRGERYISFIPVSQASLSLTHSHNIPPTQIFLVEGIITTLFGILLFFILPDDPVKSRLLSPEERRMVIARKIRDNAHLARKDATASGAHGGEPEKTTWKLVLRSFSFIVRVSFSSLITTYFSSLVAPLVEALAILFVGIAHYENETNESDE